MGICLNKTESVPESLDSESNTFQDPLSNLKSFFQHTEERPKLPTAETKIRKSEDSSPFAKQSVKNISKLMNESGFSGKLSMTQMRRAAHKLGLNPRHLQDPDNSLFKFILSLQTNLLFDIRKVVLGAILIANGKPDEKAQVLFEHFDHNNTMILEHTQIHQMLSEMLEISVEHIPILSLGESEENLQNEELKSYSKELLTFKQRFIDDTLHKIITNDTPEMYEEHFIEIMTKDQHLKQLLWARGLREWILKNYTASSKELL